MDYELSPPTPRHLGFEHAVWWTGQRDAVENILQMWRSGTKVVMLSGPTGCHALGQCVLRHDGSKDFVENIKVGDNLLGPDGTPREVLGITKGEAPLFLITPTKGDSFVVTGNHVLVLERTNTTTIKPHKRGVQNLGGRQIEVTVNEWLSWSKTQKHIHKLIRTSEVFFDAAEQTIDPYVLGLLLGDGSLDNQLCLTSNDAEVAEHFTKYVMLHDDIVVRGKKGTTARSFFVKGRKHGKSPWLVNQLKAYHLWGTKSATKFVPNNYLITDVQSRLQLLAGLLDTDGYLGHGCYEYVSKSTALADAVLFLSRSLGLAAYATLTSKKSQYGTEGKYWSVSISGAVQKIPCLIPRKVAQPRTQKKNVLRTGFTIVEVGVGEYVGFTVSGDNRYLLPDFTITHNSGKSVTGVGSAASWAVMKERELNCTVLTQTRDLQAQYAEEFPEARAATGRGNWQCGVAGHKRANQCEFIGTDEPCVPTCPYKRQRDAAVKAPIRAINYAFYGATGGLFNGEVMIADEADYLGELLVNGMSVDMQPVIDGWEFGVPQGVINNVEVSKQLNDISKATAEPSEREVCKRGLDLLASKRYAVKGVGSFLRPWPEARVVQDFARGPTLIMSATVFAPEYWSKEWNIPVGWVELPCPVPPSARPIHLLNVAKLNKNTTDSEWLEVVRAIDNLIANRVELKGLIHSVSNKLTDFILEHSKYKYMMYKAAGISRMSGIAAFLKAERGCLIGPNLTRGLNLADDACRYVIWPKVPYPSMGDARVQEMLKGGEDRYLVETLGTMIQGAGRGIRNAKDSCEILILDSNANNLFRQTKAWLPKWFAEAIVY